MARGPFRCGRESSLSRRGWAGAPAGLQGTADHAPAECRRGRVVSASTALGRQGRSAPSRSRAGVGSGRWRPQRTRPEASQGGTRSCGAEASFTAGPHTGDHQGLQKQTCERGRCSPQPSSLADHGDSLLPMGAARPRLSRSPVQRQHSTPASAQASVPDAVSHRGPGQPSVQAQASSVRRQLQSHREDYLTCSGAG